MDPAAPSKEQVLAHLDRIRASRIFNRRRSGLFGLLEYMVKECLAGRGDTLTQHTIGLGFDRKPEEWHPKYTDRYNQKGEEQGDASVRVRIARLRRRLQQFYGTDGRYEPVRIVFKARTYALGFRFHRSDPNIPALSDSAARHVLHTMTALELRTLRGYERALNHIDSVIEEPPGDARLLALKAYVHIHRSTRVPNPRVELDTAEGLIAQVKKLGRGLPWECTLAEACLRQCRCALPWSEIDRLYSVAIANSDDRAQFSPFYVAFLASRRRFAEAFDILNSAVYHRAQGSAAERADLALLYIYTDQHAEAQDLLENTLDVLGGGEANYLTLIHLAILYDAMGSPARALDTLDKVPLTPITVGFRAYLIGRTGDTLAALQTYNDLKALKASSPFSVRAGQIGIAALGAGMKDDAVKWFADGIDEHDPLAITLHLQPLLRSLHSHQGFRKLVIHRLDLPLDA